MTAVSPGFEFTSKLAELEAALMQKHPSMPTLLREIHQTLKKQPENVTLLKPEEVAIVFKALENQTNTFLADSVAKTSKKSGSVAALKAKGLDAF